MHCAAKTNKYIKLQKTAQRTIIYILNLTVGGGTFREREEISQVSLKYANRHPSLTARMCGAALIRCAVSSKFENVSYFYVCIY